MTDLNAATGAAHVDMTTSVHFSATHLDPDHDAVLASLLAQLGDDDEALDSISAGSDYDELNGDTGTVPGAAAAMLAETDALVDDLLSEIASEAEREQARQELYAEQESPTIPDGSAPQTDAAALLAPAAAKPAKPKKGKKKGSAGKNTKAKLSDAAEPPATTLDPAAPAAPPSPAHPVSPKGIRATSITHKPGDLLRIKLGDKATDFLTFELQDAELTSEALHAKQDAFIARMNHPDAIADKVKDKMSLFLLWLVKGGDLNEVLRRTLTVLHQCGELTSGDKGNLQLNLLTKPYSLGTARSQANQMFQALPELGLAIKDKGRMVPNPNSVLLGMAYAMLGLA